MSIPRLTGTTTSFRNTFDALNELTHFHGNRTIAHRAQHQTPLSWSDSVFLPLKTMYLIFSRFRQTPHYESDTVFEDHSEIDAEKPLSGPSAIHVDYWIPFNSLKVTKIFNAALIKRILLNNRQMDKCSFSGGPPFESSKALMDPDPNRGTNFFTARNQDYQNLRSFFKKALEMDNLKAAPGFSEFICKVCNTTIDALLNKQNGVVEDFSKEVLTIPSLIIQYLLLGRTVEGLKEAFWEIEPFIKKSIGNLGNSPKVYNQVKDSPSYKKFIELAKDLWEHPDEYQGILPDMIYHCNRDGSRMFDQHQLISMLIFFFHAGEETVMSALTSAFFCLAHYPNEQQKLYNSLKSYYDTKPEINLNELNAIPELDHFVKEVLRLYPPIPVLVRSINPKRENCEIPVQMSLNGESVQFEEDRQLMLELRETMRQNCESGDQFIPERFSDGDTKNYFPFSHGPNNCIGQHLAILEIKAMIYYALQKLEVVDSTKAIYSAKPTLTPLFPISIRVKSRN